MTDAAAPDLERLDVGGHRWRLRLKGAGPGVLLLHGTGASLHSVTALADRLAPEFRTLAPDLPGHGGTAPLPPSASDPGGFARALGRLLQAVDLRPQVVVAHSAGVAVALRMMLDGQLPPLPLVAINGAPLPLGGLAGSWFAPLARLVAEQGAIARLLARRAARPGVVERLIDSTGSRLDAAGVAAYRALLVNPAHLAGTLRMMANWNLPALAADLHRVRSPVLLMQADGDRTLPAGYAGRVHAALPHARVIRLGGLGHLAHEERPERIEPWVRGAFAGSEISGGDCDTVSRAPLP